MIAVDSSIAIAGFGDWHELHEPARDLLDEGVAIPAHAMLETYSVLTGFPPPHRAAPRLVRSWLDDRFATILPSPEVEKQQGFLRDLAEVGRTGGAVYDALVALTAKRADAVLATADVRASAVYELVGVELHYLA
ncbi:MAG: PIN domain-containing protein [Acidobacteriota bacterium]